MEQDDCYENVTETKYDCLLFDVDDTLYPLSSGLSTECTKNIREYMISKLGVEEEKVPEMCAELYKEYGTTMAGLRAVGHDFDYDDYHSFVHGRLPYDWLKTDHTLKNLLHTVPIRKVIFSNGNEAHVATVLSRLGLEDCFEDIICFETLNPSKSSEEPENSCDAPELPKTPIICKPFENAFEQAFKIAGINPHKTLFFDDSIRNLQTAKSIGLHTVWVGSSSKTQGVDYSLESIHNMKEALPELWEGDVDKADVPYSGKAAIEAVV
ncbi:suppressor of disruption of TFIIS-like isoform X1 [Salvia miltiorrhiza]|uniref:suppressor of disruption of TFIIS-like isoform X1 n=1 Tax=Salvia miltiorrhiza TaxID=226208 RepID=UPI0025AD2EDE|nr:suppressor of disruption of TFIIS-like isoform X1 [Salvia miltiorrhiza]